MLKRAEQGQRLLRQQRYEIRSEVAQESRVAVEAQWSAVLAVPFGSLPAGASMRIASSHIASSKIAALWQLRLRKPSSLA